MNKNVQKYIAVFLLMLTAGFALAVPASAQLRREVKEGQIEKQLDPAKKSFFVGEGDQDKSIFKLIGQAVNVIFSLVGVLLLVLIIYASFLWLTAGGNTDQVKKAKQYIRNAVIGLIIVLIAVILSQFIFGQLDRSFEKRRRNVRLSLHLNQVLLDQFPQSNVSRSIPSIKNYVANY